MMSNILFLLVVSQRLKLEFDNKMYAIQGNATQPHQNGEVAFASLIARQFEYIEAAVVLPNTPAFALGCKYTPT